MEAVLVVIVALLLAAQARPPRGYRSGSKPARELDPPTRSKGIGS